MADAGRFFYAVAGIRVLLSLFMRCPAQGQRLRREGATRMPAKKSWTAQRKIQTQPPVKRTVEDKKNNYDCTSPNSPRIPASTMAGNSRICSMIRVMPILRSTSA